MRIDQHTAIDTTDPERDEALPQKAAGTTESQAKAAAEKFEAFYIADMMRHMRRSAREFGDQDGERRDRPADEILDLSYSMVADTLAGQHAFGVADLILRQILPKQPDDATGQSKI